MFLETANVTCLVGKNISSHAQCAQIHIEFLTTKCCTPEHFPIIKMHVLNGIIQPSNGALL